MVGDVGLGEGAGQGVRVDAAGGAGQGNQAHAGAEEARRAGLVGGDVACSWQITASCGWARAASVIALAAVPEATNRTSASASTRARIRSAARALTVSAP